MLQGSEEDEWEDGGASEVESNVEEPLQQGPGWQRLRQAVSFPHYGFE